MNVAFSAILWSLYITQYIVLVDEVIWFQDISIPVSCGVPSKMQKSCHALSLTASERQKYVSTVDRCHLSAFVSRVTAGSLGCHHLN